MLMPPPGGTPSPPVLSPYTPGVDLQGQYPLREVRGPGQVGEDSQIQLGHPTLVYQLFTTTDLLNWKHHTRSYTERPQEMIDLVQSIFQTHNPTWAECRQLLLILFNAEEQWRVLQAASKWVQENAPVGTLNLEAYVQRRLPAHEPSWDPNNSDDMRQLMAYREALLQGIRKSRQQATNVAKVTEILQRPDESLEAFYERLCEAYQTYTPLDPKAPENQQMINTAFVNQSAGDIGRKFQKLEGFAGMNATQLLEVANKVFVNRDVEEKREAERKIKKKADLMITAAIHGTSGTLGPPKANQKGKPGMTKLTELQGHQCAFYKKSRHWKNIYPKPIKKNQKQQ